MIVLQGSTAGEVESALYDVCRFLRIIGDNKDSFKEICRAELVKQYQAKNNLPFTSLPLLQPIEPQVCLPHDYAPRHWQRPA